MGFNKRFLSEDTLRRSYEIGGVENVLKLYRADAIVTSDPFSTKITDIVGDFSDHRNKERLDEEIKQNFEDASRIIS